MRNNLIIKEFDNIKVNFVVIDGESKIKVGDIARFCGWTQIKNGKEYVRLERINKHILDLGFPNVGENDFIPEYIMYPLIGKADFTKNAKAKDFMIWAGKIMTELRQSGVVILENATKEAVDFKFKYGTYRIRKTFTNSNNPRSDYEEFKELAQQEWKSKRLNNTDRVKLCKLIQKGITDKVTNNFSNMRPSELLSLQELITDIQVDVTKLENKKNGGKLASATRKINQLEKALN